MTLAIRTLLLLVLILAHCGVLFAQEESSVSDAPAESPEAAASADPEVAEPTRSIAVTREELSSILRQSPPDLATVLALDPTLLANREFLAAYPELTEFLAEHPEIRQNPRFYLSEFQLRASSFDDILEPLIVLLVCAFIAVALGWLVRTYIEQKRWRWLSRTQNEVHGKILDRLGSSAELLEYVKTPVGARFLEAAPIPLHTDRVVQNPPLARVLWSIQIGVVVATAALGMLIVSGRLDGESAQGLFAMGVIVFCVGAGFIASAAVSLLLSRRLGLWQPSRAAETPERIDDPGLVR